MKLYMHKAVFLVSYLALILCDGTDNSVVIPNNTIRKQIPKGLHLKTNLGGQEEYKKIARGDLTLNDKFMAYPTWQRLKSAKGYNRYGPYNSDLYNHILDYFSGFLEYTNLSLTSSANIIAALRDMTASQLKALFYGASEKSPICRSSFYLHSKRQAIALFLHKKVQIDLAFSCRNESDSSSTSLIRKWLPHGVIGTTLLSHLHIPPKDLEILKEIEGDEFRMDDFGEKVLSLSRPSRNFLNNNILFHGSFLRLKDVEHYFKIEKRSCKVVDIFGNSPLHVALLQLDLPVALYYLSSNKCKHCLTHYNYEGNDALMYLLDNLPFTRATKKTNYTTEIAPGVQDFTHSVAYYLIKRIISRGKRDFSIRNKFGKNTYDLALKTRSLPIIHMIFSHKLPSINQLEMYIQLSVEMEMDDNITEGLSQLKPRELENIGQLTPLSYLESVEKDKSKMLDAIAKNNYNALAKILISHTTYDKIQLLDLTTLPDSYQTSIDECNRTQKRAMLWLLMEMGLKKKVEQPEDILAKWEEYDQSQCERWKNNYRSNYELQEMEDWLEKELQQGVSPLIIYKYLLPENHLGVVHGALGSLSILVKFGLNPNSSFMRTSVASAGAILNPTNLKIYLEAGANFAYTPNSSASPLNLFRFISRYDSATFLKLIPIMENGLKINSLISKFGTVKRAIANVMTRISPNADCPQLEKYLETKKIIAFDVKIDGIEIPRCDKPQNSF